MIALIDGDIAVYKAAFSVEHKEYWIDWGDGMYFRRLSDLRDYYAWNYSEDDFPFEYEGSSKTFFSKNIQERDISIQSRAVLEPVEFAIFNADSIIQSVLDRTGCTEYKVFLTGSGNFRKDIPYPVEYKGGRPAKPVYYNVVKEHLINKWKAETHPKLEADDLLGIYGTQLAGDCIICSVDKDLKQLAGRHYNLSEGLMEVVTQEEADFNFWCQMLTGDRIDNIIGLKGIGPKKAEKILNGTPREDWELKVLELYSSEGIENLFEKNLKLLRVLRSFDEAPE